jgi:hypothetical protein
MGKKDIQAGLEEIKTLAMTGMPAFQANLISIYEKLTGVRFRSHLDGDVPSDEIEAIVQEVYWKHLSYYEQHPEDDNGVEVMDDFIRDSLFNKDILFTEIDAKGAKNELYLTIRDKVENLLLDRDFEKNRPHGR